MRRAGGGGGGGGGYAVPCSKGRALGTRLEQQTDKSANKWMGTGQKKHHRLGFSNPRYTRSSFVYRLFTAVFTRLVSRFTRGGHCAVTVIGAFPRFGHPHSQNLSDMGIPLSYHLSDLNSGFGNGDAQNAGMPISLWQRPSGNVKNKEQQEGKRFNAKEISLFESIRYLLIEQRTSHSAT